MRRDLAIGLSLSTLWFVGVWSDLLPFLYISDRFPIGALPCWNDFVAVVLNVSLLGVGFAAAAQVARRGPAWAIPVAQWALLLSLGVPANAIRNHFNTWPERVYAMLGPEAGVVVFGTAGLALAAVAVKWRDRVAHVVTAMLSIMFPLVLITCGQAVWAVSQAGGRMQCGGGAGRAAAIPGDAARRVLWIVYDEMDQRTPFEGRPPDLALPEFDRLKAESLAAATAFPPSDRTERSMPAFLTGLRVADSRLVGRNQLRLSVEGRAEPFVWKGSDTVFARVRELGLNTGVAGFFLPYCAMLGETLTTCTWQPCVTCGRLTGVFGNSVGESMWFQASELLPQYGRRRHLAGFRTLQQAAEALAADRSIGFALLHLPVPHEPGIYDRTRGDFSIRSAGDPYVHNLALADRSLGQLRAALERSGLAQKTTLMVFGDHGRRSAVDGESIEDKRVPFIVRMGGPARGVTYDQPVDLLRVGELTLEILAGRIATVDELAAWLAQPH